MNHPPDLRLAELLAGLSLVTDLAAIRTFTKFLEIGHEMGVPVLPIYDSGSDAAELIAESAAVTGADRILIGSSRQGAIYHLIKGYFHNRLEALLPPEIPVTVRGYARLIVAVRGLGWADRVADQRIDARVRCDVDGDRVYAADDARQAVSIVIEKLPLYVRRSGGFAS